MKEGKGEKSIRYQYKFVIFSYSIWLNFGVHAQVNRKLEINLAFLVNIYGAISDRKLTTDRMAIPPSEAPLSQ